MRTLLFNKKVFFLWLCVVTVVIGLLATLIRLYLGIDLLRYSILLIYLNAIFLIVASLHQIRLSKTLVILILFISISIPIGLINNDFSERVILDVLKPISFIFIYAVFSKLESNEYDLIKNSLIKVSKVLMILSIIFGLSVLLLLTFVGGYPGVRLPTILPIMYYLSVHSSWTYFVILFLLTFISGKRALLLAILPIFLYRLLSPLNVRKVFILTVVFLIASSLIFMTSDYIKNTTAYNKYRLTYVAIEDYLKHGGLEKLNAQTGQRIQETTSSFYGFEWYDYILGKGVGYTYDLWNVNRTILKDTNYGNNHFSPLSLVASYGLFFALVFYLLIFRNIYSGIKYCKSNKFMMWMLFVLISYTIESFFAFTVFIYPFFPVILGLIKSTRFEIKYESGQT